MAPGMVVLGKRKRRVPADKAADVDAKPDEAAALEEAQAIFRKHFEAQFAPLEGSDDDEAGRPAAKGRRNAAAKGKGTAPGDEGVAAGLEDMRSETSDDSGEDEDESDDGDEWDGLSAEDDESDPDSEDVEGDDDGSEADETEAGLHETETNSHHQVEVVDYSKPTPSLSTLTPQTALMTKREMRAYLSSRPPDAVSNAAGGSTSAKARAKQGAGDGADDPQNEDSRSLLANDLELQRLISESHILSATNPFNSAGGAGASARSAKAFSEGRTRALTTDLRLQRLGSSGSIFKQQKMPMAVRKGILGARASREEKRRREAKENGIILEREAPPAEGGKKARRKQKGGRVSDLPVDMPGMGRMKGGELRLSKRDVRAVETEGRRMGDSRGNKGKHRKRR